MNAAFLDFATMGADELNPTPLLEVLPDVQLFPTTTQTELKERIREAEFLLVNKVRLDADVLQAAPKLRFIGLAATGTDNVDLDAARELNIAVANIRAYCTQSVVEHVFGCLLSLTHSLNRFSDDVAQGRWQQSKSFCLLTHPLRELSAMRMGVVGYGTLGKSVGKVAEAFGMQLLIARRRGEPAAEDDGRVDFDQLLALADVISLHCPLNAATTGLMAAREFEAMKDDAILINTARGGLVNSADLVDALTQGKIGGAAIDVLAEEPPVNGDPLLDYHQRQSSQRQSSRQQSSQQQSSRQQPRRDLILTPHIAWATNEARQNALREIAANVLAFQRGKARNRVV